MKENLNAEETNHGLLSLVYLSIMQSVFSNRTINKYILIWFHRAFLSSCSHVTTQELLHEFLSLDVGEFNTVIIRQQQWTPLPT